MVSSSVSIASTKARSSGAISRNNRRGVSRMVFIGALRGLLLPQRPQGFLKRGVAAYRVEVGVVPQLVAVGVAGRDHLAEDTERFCPVLQAKRTPLPRRLAAQGVAARRLKEPAHVLPRRLVQP